MHAFFFYAQSPDFHKLGLCYYLLKANKNHAYGKKSRRHAKVACVTT